MSAPPFPEIDESFFEAVIRVDPRYHASARCADLSLLEPGTRDRVRAVVEDARAAGIPLLVHETYRSRERQRLLHERGVTRLREVGVHHFGLGCDLVKDVGGEPSWKGSFAFLGRLARKHGMIWGGDWGEPGKRHSLVDAVHVQRVPVWRQRALFRGTFYPGLDYDPREDPRAG